jgi:choline monooxygenase
MTQFPSPSDFAAIRGGYRTDCSRPLSLKADAYTWAKWFDADLRAIMGKHWNWVCHIEKLRQPGSYIAL